MKNTALLGILAVLVLEAGCMMGPKYKRPAVNVPQEYRTPEPQLATQASSLGNEQWWQLYQDPVLTQSGSGAHAADSHRHCAKL
jgi:multidrug efflux system outer membrane protein